MINNTYRGKEMGAGGEIASKQESSTLSWKVV